MSQDRLQLALAALDDARTYLVDAIDARPLSGDMKPVNHLDAAVQFINSAVNHIHLAQEKP